MSTASNSTRPITSFFQRMRARNVAETPEGLDSLESPADLSTQTESTLEALTKIVEKYLNNDPHLIEVARKIVEQGGEGLRMLGQRDESGLQQRPEAVEGLEAIVRMDGSRPSFMIRNGEIDRETSPIGSWAPRLATSEAALRKAIASVGRIDVPGSSVGFQGTGFQVAPNLIVTNRHVLQVSARERRPGVWELIDGAAIDFGHEFQGRNSVNRRTLRRVVFCGSRAIEYTRIDHSKLDLALIEFDPATGPSEGAQESFSLSTTPHWASPQTVIFTVGYPGSPPSSVYAPSLLEQLFQSTYGCKRLAPGEVIQAQTAVNPWTLAHDATTLGGNSGSVILVADREEVAAGLHYGGRPSEPRENWGHVLASVFDETDGRSSRTLREVLRDYGVSLDGTLVRPEPPLTELRGGQSPELKVPLSAPGAGGAAPAAVATFNVPIRITVTVGTPVPAAGPAGALPETGGEVEKVPVIFPDLETRKGYDPDFLNLDEKVRLPQLTSAGNAVAARLEDGTFELKYHKFSVVMHKRRRLALFTAANVDWRSSSRLINGEKPSRKVLNGFTGNEREDWVIDPRIPFDNQLPDFFFTKDRGAFDKGHLVRRDDVTWGKTFEDIQKGNGDTFHTTNCSPQTAEFNRAAENNWGALENMIQKQTASEKICLFSGPVLDESDPVFEGRVKSGTGVRIKIPSRFWKIIVFKKQGKPAAYGFVIDQDLTEVPLTEFVVPDAWKRFLVRVSEIEDLLGGLVKLTKLKEWDQFRGE